MFHSARIKLTIWYVLIIMLISMLFSLVIYTRFNAELNRFEHLHRLRIEQQQDDFPFSYPPRRLGIIDPDMINETRDRLAFLLLMINCGILVLSGGASYFLAGRTLAPIKEMVEEQNRFITDASHELRTPLTALRSEIEVYLRDAKLTLTQAKNLLKSNLQEVVNLQSLSDNLMDLASFQKKNDGLTFESVSLSEILNSAVEKIKPMAKIKNIIINKEDSGLNLKIEGNRQSLIQLLVVLLDNAVKYSNDKDKIFIKCKQEDRFVSISIKDTGIGIDKKDLPNIFDRFFRADLSRSKAKVTGYGLGLSIAQKIIRLHNGQIKAESRLNFGSTFTVSLPVSQGNYLNKFINFS